LKIITLTEVFGNLNKLNNMKFKFCVFTTCLILVSCGISEAVINRPTTWAQKIQSSSFQNLYKVDENLFRSEQPTKMGMKELQGLGVKTILNVRNLSNDNCEGKSTNLILRKKRINTWTIKYDEVVSALKIIKESPKPVLIHCKHGSDRTGCIVAAYRMSIQNWTKLDAIYEFKNGGYGFHEDAFKNVLMLLESIDVEKLKNELK
jgi:tyrosine-protein phosphatase SIW14